MALKLIASYSKCPGLPAYSSHQFSVSIETELTSQENVSGETARLYETLQRSVDEQIQETGFVPTDGYGQNGSHSSNGNGHNGSAAWQCSDKQRELILGLIEEHHLNKVEIESVARERFGGKGVKQLSKFEASVLIEMLFELVAQKPTPPARNGSARPKVHGGTR